MTAIADLSARALLDGWQQALGLAPAARPIAVLSRVTGAAPAALAELPIGERDGMLLALRRRAIGDRAECEAECPACHERLEFGFDLQALELQEARADNAEHLFETDGLELRFRLPSTGDLLKGASAGDEREAARRILCSCILEARRDGAAIDPWLLDDLVLERLAEHCRELDPQADTRVALACDLCGHRWEADFDIASFLWQELEAWALRMLEDIHVIAAGYGWTEAEILQLDPSRRRWYAERLQA